MTKFIAITGGVLSGLGKGIIVSSIGNLLKNSGYSVTAIKIDPYINVDAGTMRPTEHGEVFVTKDGGETDQDLGNYERFIGKELSKNNNITTGQIYLKVIEDERKLKYKGKCVEVVPHIAMETKRRILEIAENTKSDFVIIEVGGTIGDYQNILFLDALRMMKLKNYPFLFIHAAYLPIPSKIGEMKTKPLQHSVRALNSSGIQPKLLFCRSRLPIDEVRRNKIAMFTNVKKDRIFSSPDVDSIYEIPTIFSKQGVTKKILDYFKLDPETAKESNFKKLIDKKDKLKQKIKIAIIGKYFDTGKFFLSDSYISVIESLKFASWKNNVLIEISWINSKKLEEESTEKILKDFNGLVVPGGFGKTGINGKLNAIKYARENNLPYLGLCYGMQLALIEYAKNVCQIKNANSHEIDSESNNCIIDFIEKQKDLIKEQNYGGTMRLGAYAATLKKDSKVYNLYKDTGRLQKDKEKITKLQKNPEQIFRLGKINQDDPIILERHRHRYEVNPKYIEKLESAGIIFSGTHTRLDGTKLMEFIELPKHKFFVATQSHPEFKSYPEYPSPLFYGFIEAAKNK
jgi:CTP synthase